MPQYKLNYFDLRGMAEPARLIFHYAGQEFEDRRLTQEEWAEIKPRKSLKFKASQTGKVPWLDIDDERIYESLAITRYLGRVFKLAGKDEMEAAQIDSIIDTYKDFFKEAQAFHAVRRGRKEGNVEELKPKYEDNCKKWFNYLQKRFDKAGSGFITSKVTWGDFLLAEGILTIGNFDEEFAGKYPKIVEYQKRIHSLPEIKEYVQTRKELQY